MEKATLEELTGYLGVGAVEMLGAFLIADGRSNLIDTLNELKAPESLALAGAIPLLVICYVVGLVTANLVQAAVHAVHRPAFDRELFAMVITAENEALLKRFSDVERQCRLLFGCCGAFLVVAIGCVLEVTQLGSQLSYIGNVCAVVGVLVAVVCVPLAYKLQSEFAQWTKAAVKVQRGI